MIPGFFTEQTLDFEQVKALVHALWSLAEVDGIDERERTLIEAFYKGCARPGDPTIQDIVAGEFDPKTAAQLFQSPELRDLYLKSLVLLAFADGQFTSKESTRIQDYVAVLGLSNEDIQKTVDGTKEFLMSGLAHVKNLDALVEVRKKLDSE